jgi:hypothetical protein
METPRALTRPVSRVRVSRLLAATALGLSLTAAPALAADEPAAEDGGAVAEETAETEEEGGGKIQLAETPRDRVGLIMLGFLGAITAGAGITAVRQLTGTRPQATGEFRWR